MNRDWKDEADKAYKFSDNKIVTTRDELFKKGWVVLDVRETTMIGGIGPYLLLAVDCV